jgi:hypothetical protein
MNVAVVRKTQVSRPLKVLVPLIKNELGAADQAGLEHYRRAGEMLLEAREQVSGSGGWTKWLSQNFELSKHTAYRYMKLAEHVSSGGLVHETIHQTLGERQSDAARRTGSARSIRDFTANVNVNRLADERQSRDAEIRLHRELALKLIDLGYRALATRLHPDQGGSRDAMARLNTVREQLKDIATTRRFV